MSTGNFGNVGPYDLTNSAEIQTLSLKRVRDVMGRLKVTRGQNIYEADFEYGPQPLRWDSVNIGSGSITHIPGEGGIRMSISITPGDYNIRQSRPYHRYQPGKSMFMATAINFGVNNANQVQRVGYFDDANGIFFEQGANPLDPLNPSGMFAVVRSDVSSTLSTGRPIDTRIPASQWTDQSKVLSRIDWTRIQMLWLEYAWYGAGSLRWGVLLDGEPYILHEIGSGNNAPVATQSSPAPLGGRSTATSTTTFTVDTASWRQGEYASRLLQINASTVITGSTFQLPAATINVASTTGFPTASGSRVTIKGQTIRYTGVTATTLTGCTGGNAVVVPGDTVVSENPSVARITGNTSNTLAIVDLASGSALATAPTVGHNWQILTLPGAGRPWSRTGNLPVRYEQRNVGSPALANEMIHYGVSVLVEGEVDDQRGFTYAYGSPWSATSANAGRRAVAGSANRIPVVSIRGRTMGTQEYTQATAAITAGSTSTLTAGSAAWAVNQWAGRCVNYGTPAAGMLPNMARITSNTATVLSLIDPTGGAPFVTAPVAGQSYTIGQINRGQLLPRRLQITSDQPIFVEIVTSTPTSAVNLTGANFVANAASPNSFALIDSSATAYTASGEVVYSIFVPANQPVDQQIDNLFPLVNSVRGNATDILTVLVTNTSASTANVSIQIIGQEAMS
jgi:hypothetical protein